MAGNESQNVGIPFPVAADRLWFDPATVGRNLYVVPTDVDVLALESKVVAPNNPYRWAVGFMLKPGSGDGAYIAPWSDVLQGAGVPLSRTVLLWYDLTTYGPLVMGPWFAAGGAGSVCRVIEVIRRVKG